MALIDVSELLLDPDFVDSLGLIHRSATVNSKGENILVEATAVVTVGSIQPASQKDLMRVPESMRIKDLRAFWIKAEIVTDGSGTYPDIIVFNGKRFEVYATEPWLNYGAGYNKGLCVAQSMV